MITPLMLPLVELQPEHIDRIVRSVLGGVANIQDIYPLAPLQEGLLFHHKLDERREDTYVLPLLLSISSRDRLDDFIAALEARSATGSAYTRPRGSQTPAMDLRFRLGVSPTRSS